jgi:Type I phosphodiesterase / nucleotide pyrophosphatase
MLRTFADIPDEVRRRIDAGERLALIVLDAFGLGFLRQHADHPLVQRLEIAPLRSQFPSTTTAHVTTLHFGLPVEQHGLYEWNVLEPALDAIICPLRFKPAGSDVDGSLAACLDPAVLAPGPTFYETLNVAALVLQPRPIEDSAFTRIATRGAAVEGFDELAEGLQLLADTFSGSEGTRYALLYWDAIDRAGHVYGPSSAEFHEASRAALDALWDGLRQLQDVTVLITADHGQIDVSPDRVDYLDDLWPELPSLLSHARPAGSSRDVFLHVRDGLVATVISELAVRLGDRGDVGPATKLFDHVGPRLAQRLGDVAVLPSTGRQAWLRQAAANEQWFLGQHGGLNTAETATYLAELGGA